MSIENVAFVGLGYIGLPTAVTFANHGMNVTGVDVDKNKVETINQGKLTIVEPGLQEALKEALESGKFRATTEMPHADAYIVAVPTPFTDGHNVDMEYIYSAADAIAPTLRGGELIVLESTSPPRTTERMAQRILDLCPHLVRDGDCDRQAKNVIYFAHCPERILPGNAMEELRTNDRIIGGMSETATSLATELYGSFCSGKLLSTNERTAELAKLTENSFRDVNIAFANELSLICDELGIDVWELIGLANHHPRVNILEPGPGVGGHCIAVDPWFIVSAAPETSRLIHTARQVNDEKPGYVVRKVLKAAEESKLEGIAVLGLAFKPNIDDLRESPAVRITSELAERLPGTLIHAVEPNVGELPLELQGHRNIKLETLENALDQSSVVVLLVNHDEFYSLSKEELQGKAVVDTKGLWNRPGA